MKEMTLRELCDAFGVTRRAVQGYEKLGLVHAAGKNRMGHLLYDRHAQERIKKIRQYQRFGFQVKEMQALFSAPDEVVRSGLEEKLNLMKQEKVRIEGVIRELSELIRSYDCDAGRK